MEKWHTFENSALLIEENRNLYFWVSYLVTRTDSDNLIETPLN